MTILYNAEQRIVRWPNLTRARVKDVSTDRDLLRSNTVGTHTTARHAWLLQFLLFLLFIILYCVQGLVTHDTCVVHPGSGIVYVHI